MQVIKMGEKNIIGEDNKSEMWKIEKTKLKIKWMEFKQNKN